MGKRWKSLGTSIRGWGGGLLLLLYLTGAVQVDVLHRWFHHDDPVVHYTPEMEQNPCHRSIYHHESEPACNHQAHIQIDPTCALCGIVCHTPHLLTIRTVVLCASVKQNVYEVVSPFQDNVPSWVRESRGPPVV